MHKHFSRIYFLALDLLMLLLLLAAPAAAAEKIKKPDTSPPRPEFKSGQVVVLHPARMPNKKRANLRL